MKTRNPNRTGPRSPLFFLMVIMALCAILPGPRHASAATAGIVSPADGYSATVGFTVPFVGSAAGVTGTPAYQWISSRDGEIGTDQIITVNSLSIGVHTIAFIVTDDNGPSNVPEITITITNTNPVAAITNPLTGATFALGSTISFQGAGTDAEDDDLTGTSLTWTSSINGTIGTGSPLSVSTLSAGTHTITLTATDSHSAMDTDTITITVNQNTAPTATITHPATGFASASGSYVTLQGAGTDTEDGPLAATALTWTSSIDGIIGSGSPLMINDLAVGVHTITLSVKDSKNTYDTDSISLIITNTAPTAAISNPLSGATYTTKDFITFIGTGTDTEDGILASSTLSWSSSRDGELGTGSPMTLNTLSAGAHTITLTVVDKDGSTGATTAGITVNNTSPSVTITTPLNNASFDQGADIVFNSAASDTEDGVLSGSSLVWTSNLDGQIGTGTTFSTNDLSKGLHILTLTARDRDNATGTASITITTGNTAPTASITLPHDGDAYTTGTTVIFNGVGVDLEGQVTYSWESNIDGLLSAESYFTSSALSKGTHVITFTVTDENNKSTTTSITITTGNGPPTAVINNPLNGSTYKEGETLYFNGTANDTEDGALSGSNLVWTSNRDGLLTTIGTGLSFSTNTLLYGTHTIYMTATDQEQAFTKSTPIKITITRMALSPEGLTLYESQKGTLTLSGGTPPYSLSNRYTQIAGASIDKTTGSVTVVGLLEGKTTIVVTDANRMTASANVMIMSQADSDLDGVPDAADSFPEDGDEWTDTDLDGTGDNEDLDDDGDGMPDEWESLFGLNPLADDGYLDLDADGFTNMEEYADGSDPSNAAPDTPLLYLPVSGSQTASLAPVLMTHPFSDSELEDTHLKTRWQIASDVSFSTLLMDTVSDQYLTALTVFDYLLEAPTVQGITTAYYWRVQFFDNHEGESQWSAPYSFYTSLATDTSDQANHNGVPDDQEVDESVDLDKNGVPDSLQDEIRTFQVKTEAGVKQMAILQSTNVTAIDGVKSIAVVPDLPHAPKDLPFGLISLKIKVFQPGETAKLKIYLSEPVPLWSKWFTYDPENGWADHSALMELEKDGYSLTLYLKDGGQGDGDGLENGVIIDPSGLSTTPPEEGPDKEKGDGDGGCFIRTIKER